MLLYTYAHLLLIITTLRFSCSNTLLRDQFLAFGIHCRLIVHNLASKLLKQQALQRLGKEVRNHLLCWTIDNASILPLNIVGDKEISNLSMSGFSYHSLVCLLLASHALSISFTPAGLAPMEVIKPGLELTEPRSSNNKDLSLLLTKEGGYDKVCLSHARALMRCS